MDGVDFIYNIPDENYETLKLDIDKLSKKNEKLGLPAIFLMPIGFKDEYDSFNSVHRIWEVMISGPVPEFEEWEFVGKIDFHRNSGNLIYCSPSKTMPEKYNTIESICEHCNQKRFRKTGYVITKDGEHKVVGSSCVNKFFNHLTPEKIAKYYEVIRRARKACSSYHGTIDTTVYSSIDLKWYIHNVLESIRTRGWVSASTAKSTANINSSTAEHAYALYANVVRNTNYSQEVGDIITWASGISDEEASSNNFMNNIRVIARDGIAKLRDKNYIAAMVNTYLNLHRKTTNIVQSKHIGAVGDKYADELVVVNVFTPLSGDKVIVKFRDKEGNLFTWFNHGKNVITSGEKYTVKGRIIAHSTYKNINETVLTRVKAEKAA